MKWLAGWLGLCVEEGGCNCGCIGPALFFASPLTSPPSSSPPLLSSPLLSSSRNQPTNHLDADTARALCLALCSYDGAIIAVSHDEAFVGNVIASASADNKGRGAGAALPRAGELWVMSKQRVTRYDGSFADYKRAIRRKVEAGLDHNSI